MLPEGHKPRTFSSGVPMHRFQAFPNLLPAGRHRACAAIAGIPRRRWLPLANVVAVLLAAATVACDSGTATSRTGSLVSVASVSAPFSMDTRIVLVDEDLVCMNNSFEMRVRCVDRHGDLIGVFGREGEGSGEFELPPGLLRGPNGTVGAIHINRLSVFSPDGDLVDEIALPVNFSSPASKAFGTTLFVQDHVNGSFVPAEVQLSSGTLLWEREAIDDIAETECGRVSLGVVSPAGGWTFPACQRELVFLEDRDAPRATVIQSPTYAEELPNERDIADIDARNRHFAFQRDLNVYRETPKRNHLRVGSLAHDDEGRLWVATERDRAHFSYFDIYVGVEHVGTVRIKDRLLSYDLYGSTLAALVEREPDADGISRRAVDWYHIGVLNFGLETRPTSQDSP